MTKEELIAKSGELITEGFVNILLRAYDEGYKQGLKVGEVNECRNHNLTRVRFFDFHLPSDTIWVAYADDASNIYSYSKSIECGLKLPTEEQAMELLMLTVKYAQYDDLHHLHIKDVKDDDHDLFYYYQSYKGCTYHYEGLAIWWKQKPDGNDQIQAIVLQHDKAEKRYYFSKESISISDPYLTMFVAPKC